MITNNTSTMSYYYCGTISAGLDINPHDTTQHWTGAQRDEPVFEEFEGAYHMRERLTEDPSNTLYMLYPNGNSQRYPYPGEYEPYSYQIYDYHEPSISTRGRARASTASGSRSRGRTTAAENESKKVTKAKRVDSATTSSGSVSTHAAGPSTPQKPRRPSSIPRKKPTSSGSISPVAVDPATSQKPRKPSSIPRKKTESSGSISTAAGEPSTPKKPRKPSSIPRKKATSSRPSTAKSKPASSYAPEALSSAQKHTSPCKVPSPLRNEIKLQQTPPTPLQARHIPNF